MTMHESITPDRVEAACEDGLGGLGNPGFCLACGADAEGCEPDAGPLSCECCGARKVFGAEQVAIMLFR